MCNSKITYCPSCQSSNVKKNGLFNKKKHQQYKCKDCSKKFSEAGNSFFISQTQKDLTNKLLLERLSLRGICRVLGFSLSWLLGYLKEVYKDLPKDLACRIPAFLKQEKSQFTIQCYHFEGDELWSFVGSKENAYYIWLVMHRATRQIVAMQVGDRSKKTAQKLWDKIPKDIQENGTFYTDNWGSYKGIIPKNQHSYSKCKKDTNHLERFNNTLRHRVSRLVRQNLAFSKALNNHIKAIQYFICHYNKEMQKKYKIDPQM